MAGVSGKRGHWRTKPPDAESAVGVESPRKCGQRPHLSGSCVVGVFLELLSVNHTLKFFYSCFFGRPKYTGAS
jgi:hypothetical protein